MTKDRYGQIIEEVFASRYSEGSSSVEFSRDELEEAASRLSIPLPKNPGDIVYSFQPDSQGTAAYEEFQKAGV